jgi:hypothetical protein
MSRGPPTNTGYEDAELKVRRNIGGDRWEGFALEARRKFIVGLALSPEEYLSRVSNLRAAVRHAGGFSTVPPVDSSARPDEFVLESVPMTEGSRSKDVHGRLPRARPRPRPRRRRRVG